MRVDLLSLFDAPIRTENRTVSQEIQPTVLISTGRPDEQPAHARDVHSHSGSRYSVFPQAPDTP